MTEETESFLLGAALGSVGILLLSMFTCSNMTEATKVRAHADEFAILKVIKKLPLVTRTENRENWLYIPDRKKSIKITDSDVYALAAKDD